MGYARRPAAYRAAPGITAINHDSLTLADFLVNYLYGDEHADCNLSQVYQAATAGYIKCTLVRC